MSQARQYRDDPSSYRNTGIPRGNPQRYGSSGVYRMGGERPKEDTNPDDYETEAQRELRELAKKQMNTDITIKGTLGKRKHFMTSASHQPAVGGLHGVVSVQEYQRVEAGDQQRIYLKSCGLNDEEIELYLQHKHGQPSKQRKIGINPSVISAKLSAIEEKIEEKEKALSKTDEFKATKTLSRHEMDLEKSLTLDNKKSKLISNLVTTKVDSNVDKNDPVNCLNEIIEDISKSKPEAEKTSKDNIEKEEADEEKCVQCRKLQILEKYGHRTNLRNKKDKNFCRDCFQAQKLKYEREKSGIVEEESDEDEQTKNIGPLPKGKLGPWTRLDEIELIPKEVIERYRLSLDEIRLIPRFADYSPGQPSKKLFLKNLSHHVTETDLVSLFHRYQRQGEDKINYKLMTGRMKGQAFVTFHDEATASEALKLVTGYPLKDRPIIAMYGKKK